MDEDGDQNSILFQAMKEEMLPPTIDQVTMRRPDPAGQYNLGVEMRVGQQGGGVANPLRMQRPPNDFAGRPTQANDNPQYLRPNDFGSGSRPQRPDPNVVNDYQNYWRHQKYYNERDGMPPDPTAQQTLMQRIRDFFSTRPPNSGLFD